MPSFLCLSQQRMLLSHQINLMFVQGSGGSLTHHSRAHKSLFVSQHRVVPLPRGKPQGHCHLCCAGSCWPVTSNTDFSWLFFGAVEELFYHSFAFLS